MRLHSYPSIYNIGHKAIVDLFTKPVLVEEKVDGSQFTFGIIDGELCFRSKGAEIYLEAPEKMFAEGVEAVKQVKNKLVPDWHYRAEYFKKPKHNCLAYDRIPRNHLAIFDIDRDGLGDFVSYALKSEVAEELGFEVVPKLYQGTIETLEQFQALLDTTSFLGGQKIEGVVIKPLNYDLWGIDKKVLMGKFVREEFRELNHKNFKSANPRQGDILQIIGQQLRTEARWHKAVQHLKDSGQLESSPKDIGKLFKEVPVDLLKECELDIRDQLFNWAWPSITRIATAGLAEWYKDYLLKEQFNVGQPNEQSA